MAARDILTLDHPMAPRLLRLLYGLALILIALGVILGVARGVDLATRMPPLAPLPVTAGSQLPATPDAGMGRRFGGLDIDRRGIDRRGMGRPGMGRMDGRPFGINLRRQPLLFGALTIVRTLVMGFVALLVVRILAEMALAVLAIRSRDNAAL
jgi:hypothetical protein